MSGLDFNNMDGIHLDVLKEIANIGAGSATTALSKMIDKKINMGMPQVKVLEFRDLAEVLGGAENLVVGILIAVKGEIGGMMMFILEQASAHNLVNLLMNRDVSSFEDFDEMDMSALKEIGNIIAGAYLTSVATLTKLRILTTVPYMAIDMAGAILSVPAIECGEVSDRALVIQTDFGGELERVFGYFVLIPDMDSYETIFRSLGMMS